MAMTRNGHKDEDLAFADDLGYLTEKCVRDIMPVLRMLKGVWGMYTTSEATAEMMADLMANMTWYALGIAALIILGWLLQAALAGSLARQKGYSGAAGFIIALLLPAAGLIYQAGRPISQEMEDERQRALAVRIAKAIRKSEQGKTVRMEEAEQSVRGKFGRKG